MTSNDAQQAGPADLWAADVNHIAVNTKALLFHSQFGSQSVQNDGFEYTDNADRRILPGDVGLSTLASHRNDSHGCDRGDNKKFPYVLYSVLEDPKFHQYIKWHDDVENDKYGFLIADIGKFETLVLPRCFKGCSKGSSFIKQLSNYGFKKIGRNSRQAFYVHRGGKFLRGHPELLGDVGRPEDHPLIPLPDPMHAQLLAQRSSITDPVTSPSNDCQIFDCLKSQTEELRSKAQVLEGIVDGLLQRVQTLENTVSLLVKENIKLKAVVKDGRATADDPVRLLNQHCPPVLENPRNHATQVTQIRMNEPNANPTSFVLEGMEFLITADGSAKPMPHPVSPTTAPTGGDFNPVNDIDNPGSPHYQAGPLTDVSFNERIFHNARYSLPAQSSSNPFDLTAGAKPPVPLHRHHRLPIIDSTNQSRTSIDHSGKPMAQVPLARPQAHASRYVFSSNPFNAVTGQQQVASSPHELGVPQTISLPTLPASETPLYPPLQVNGSAILSELGIATELWGKISGPPSRVIGLKSGSMIDESYNDVAGELSVSVNPSSHLAPFPTQTPQSSSNLTSVARAITPLREPQMTKETFQHERSSDNQGLGGLLCRLISTSGSQGPIINRFSARTRNNVMQVPPNGSSGFNHH